MGDPGTSAENFVIAALGSWLPGICSVKALGSTTAEAAAGRPWRIGRCEPLGGPAASRTELDLQRAGQPVDDATAVRCLVGAIADPRSLECLPLEAGAPVADAGELAAARLGAETGH